MTYFVPTTANDATEKVKAVKQLISAFAQDTGTTLLVSQSATRVHVSPGMVRDASGQLQLSRPILDTIISIPSQDRDGIEFLHALCGALTEATSYIVFVGTTPINAMAQFHTKVGYENVSARQALEDFLNSMPNGKRYTWALLFQKDYALNIHWVRDLNQRTETRSSASSAPHRKFDVMHSPDGTKTVYIAR